MTAKAWHRILVIFVTFLVTLLSNVTVFAGCGPDIIIWGNAYVDGRHLTKDDEGFTVTMENLNGVELSNYKMGSDPLNLDWYVLRVPTENWVADPCYKTVGAGGDQANIYINGIPVDENPVTLGNPASMSELAINVTTGEQQIPDVTNMSEEDARTTLGEVGFVNVAEIEECNNDVAEGNVIRTEPEADETVAPDSEVIIVISTGMCNDVPVITSTAPATATEDVEYTYNPVATDTENDTLTWSLSNAPSGMEINSTTGAITWTPGEGVTTSGAVTLTVDDGNGGTDTEEFTITVTEVNDAPVITSTAPATATEDVEYTYNPVATDTENDTLTWSLSNAPSGMEINSTTGAITWTPGEGVTTSGAVTLTVDDGNGGTDTEEFTITVTEVNDAPVITSTAPATATEDVEYTYNPVATDTENDTLTWSLSNAPSGMEINSTTGAITWTPGEGVTTSGAVTLTVDDGNGGTDTEEFTITVTEVNDAPVITSTAPATATEDVEYTYNPVATDTENDTLTWSLSNAPSGMEINSTTGAITWTPGEGVTTSGAVTLTVDDGNGGTDTEEFTITVTEVNDAPVITSTAPATATEDVEYTYNPVATDTENDTLTWSLSNAPSGMEINSTTGAITWTPGEGVTTSGAVTLTVDDGNGGTDTEEFTITVTEVNDAPVITSTAPATATEDVEYTYNPVATDTENDTLTWSLSNAPSGMEINSTTGAITWTPGEGVTTSGAVTLTVDDGNGGTDTEEFTITVTEVNDAPVITSTAPATATEDVEYTYNPVATDTENDTLTWSLSNAPSGMEINSTTGAITWTPGEGVTTSGAVTLTVDDGNGGTDTEEFTITVTEVNDAPVITSTAPATATEDVEYTYNPVATDTENDTLTWSLSNAPSGMEINSTTGAITWTPGEGVTTSGAVTLTVDDGNGGTDTEEFTITVTEVNDAPVITSTAPATATEDVEYTYNPVATDTENDTLTWSLSNAPSGMEINSTTGAITWTPGEGVTTSGAVTLTVDDGNGGTDTEEFTITVTEVNDAPVITSTAPATATEDVEYTYNPVATDTENDTLTWSLSNAPSGMEINSTTGAITWTPGEGVTTSGAVTLTVDDGNGGTDTEEFTITVTEVNDAPVITSTAPTTATEGVEYSYNPTATDADGDTLTWSLTGAPSGMEINSETGAIIWTPGEGVTSSGTLTLTVDDGNGGTQSDVFMIMVTAVNESPVAEDGGLSTDEDVAVSDTLSASDADGDSLTFSIVDDGILGTVTITNASTGAFTYTPDGNANGNDSFTFKANDELEDSNIATVIVIINAVNDAPVADAGPDQADVFLGEIQLAGNGTDVDEDQITFNWTIINEPYTGAGQLDVSDSASPKLDIEEYGTYEVELEVCDDDVCDTDTVQIATEGNLPPVANAGDDKTVGQYDDVCLEGSGFDPNGDEISYQWTIIEPDGTGVLPDDSEPTQPCFRADQIGDYTATLVVNDGYLDSEPDEVTISVEGNSKPVADAGEDRDVNVGEDVCLDGGDSSDPDGDDISYSWAIISRPVGSGAVLDNPVADNPCFTPDVSGAYLVQLTVTDEHGLPGDPVTVTITATEGEEPEQGDINEDGIVDMDDLNIILAARNTPADGPDDPRDLDGDGMITALDARKLVLLCTCPRCVCP